MQSNNIAQLSARKMPMCQSNSDARGKALHAAFVTKEETVERRNHRDYEARCRTEKWPQLPSMLMAGRNDGK